jgi:hypothetical protein
MEHGERLYRQLFRKENFIGYDGGDRGCAPYPAAFFVVIRFTGNIYRTPPKNPLVRGRSVAGWQSAGGGTKNFEYTVQILNTIYKKIIGINNTVKINKKYEIVI